MIDENRGLACPLVGRNNDNLVYNTYLLQLIIIESYKRYLGILCIDINYRSGNNPIGVYKEDKTLYQCC